MQVGEGVTQVIEKPKKSRVELFLDEMKSASDSSRAAEIIISEIRGDPVSTSTLRKALKTWAELREEEADRELELSLGC